MNTNKESLTSFFLNGSPAFEGCILPKPEELFTSMASSFVFALECQAFHASIALPLSQLI
ncbi:hypothetical protein COU78_03955 [Candidatus Peregrinibacteria bacterium CG10_big_fil_rev_8_21_14_0_10_49_24]|nr:MAG: hypothetical protein COU78_03955 [Candidatus Peregrinibacteria bacterium CG10_big_fil_rev_8_21_14_0_10_49_24]PJA67304.1 MAG: hypothetical protein CO157_05300 [Candidatus Peregrinibacteria bacterium CG_4_9_14_3_um_filter_49_12]